jgi:pimeloyl-ACP methyl ester carboxylesterase
MNFPITEHIARSARHITAYLSCGAADAPLILFVHGWPELAISWRHQLRCFAQLGFRAIAPDMRGYGRSSQYPRHADYAVEHAVADMLELLAELGAPHAIWVGHDWGTPVVWSLASHHPEHCLGVAGLCVPYLPQGFAPATCEPYIDRAVYPREQFPAGQWDYMLYYEEHFARAQAVFEADPLATVKAMFRKGSAAGRGKPARLATVRRDGGHFGGADAAPDLPADRDILSDEDLHQYAAALTRNGFFGPGSWYMNAQANLDYAARARQGGRLDMPVLFFHAAHDFVCETLDSPLAGPMREHCTRLTEQTVASGHWMAQEQPVAVNAGLARWLAHEFPGHWPI